MRILHILNDLTNQGNGIVNTAVDIAIGQARLGNTVGVVSSGGAYQALLRDAGVQHLPIKNMRSFSRSFNSLFALRRHVREFRPDVVHAHMRTGLLLAWFLSLVRRYALVAHVHNVHDPESVLMGLAHRVLVVSNSVGETMQGMGIPRRKIRVVLNRILNSPRLPDLARVVPAALQRPSIVTVCGMSHRKGISELIAAFERIAAKSRNANLYLVGDGPDRAVFEKQANSSVFRDRIHFEGFQSSPQSYMLAADVFVLASRRESFSLVLTEARQAGCAIVASNVDGIPEALDAGCAGVLVPPLNVSALAEALDQMLSQPEHRTLWSERAKQGVEAFEICRMVQEIMSVYREVIPASGYLNSSSTLHRESRRDYSDAA